MRISICVCTYNRAHILRFCLESLAQLKVPTGYEAEVLVVDNNSNDHTKEVVSYYRQHSPIEILYFHESQQGLSAARNRATKEAGGDYIGFLDDECVAQPNWLEIIAADIDEFSPFIIGGPYAGALLPITGPKWFKVEYGDAYFLAYNFSRGYQKDFRASGGNMVLHRSVFETRQFDTTLGLKGSQLKFGEEISLQEHFISENEGVMVFYEPSIEVMHYILPHKMSLGYHARRQMELGACHCRYTSAELCYQLTRALGHLCLCPFRTALRDQGEFPYWQNYVYERVIPRVMPTVGAALERFRKLY
jgi:glucosyl-dolichyl phosphate glucuronosyltransferase